jgi:steroid delta-isomerase-like uncharacterized protein
LSSFSVSPGHVDVWIETWQDLARIAVGWPGCRSFRLLKDDNDNLCVATLSEWDDVAFYHAFIRGSGAMWLQRAIGGTCRAGGSGRVQIFEAYS